MADMTEQDLADYVDGTVLNGEFSTLQAMPEIAEALERAKEAQENPATCEMRSPKDTLLRLSSPGFCTMGSPPWARSRAT